MKDVILNRLKPLVGIELKFNMLREDLQCMVLKVVEERGYIKNLAFVGGTALRFLYDLKRFSEDLDFSLVDPAGFSFDDFVKDIEKSFDAWGIGLEFKSKSVGAVQNMMLKFSGLMYETGVSRRQNQKLLIKLEVDTKPPAGYRAEVSFLNKLMPMNVCHYDLPSLFSGKLHACLFRQYTKARDFYDLMWFLNKKIQPNLPQLENAIFQTTGDKPSLDIAKLKKMLADRIKAADFEKIRREISVFLADPSESKYLTRENMEQLNRGLK